MKKFFRIFLITMGLILLLLIALPILFKSKIEEAVKDKINQDIHASVDWTKFNLSFFRGFPDLSINLHQVSVVGKAPFEGDTLAGLKRFEIRVNPFSALKKEIQVKSILLDQPLLNGKVLEDGSANWDLTQSVQGEESDPQAEEASDQSSGNSFSAALKNFKIRSGRILYEDLSSGTKAALSELNLDLSGDFAMDLTRLDLRVDVGAMNARYGGVGYLKDAVFAMDLSAEADLLKNQYTLHENEIRLNGLVLGAEGVVTLLEEEAVDLDLNFFSKETDFQALLSMVPAIYLKNFESVKTSGQLQLEGSVKGVMKDSLMPDVYLVLQVSDGYFAYPGLPKDVSEVQIHVALDYKGTDMDATTVDVKQFHLMLGSNPFELSAHMDHPISDMHVAGEAKGLIDFAGLKDVVPMEDVKLEGRLETDLRWDTRMSFIEAEQYDQVDLEGRLLMEELGFESEELSVPVQISKMHMDFNPRYVNLVALDMTLGSSDLQMHGELSNFIPYIFDGQTIAGTLFVNSHLLDANEFLPGTPEVDSVDEEGSLNENVPADSLPNPSQLKIPENIEFAMMLQMDRVIYENITVEDIQGKMELSKGIAYLDDLRLSTLEGEVSTWGKVDTRGEFAEADVSIDVKGIDIQEAYTSFMAVEKLAPMAKYCRGTASMTVEYKSLLDASFAPLYESINASGEMYTQGLKIHDLAAFGLLSEVLKNDKLKDIAPDEVEASFTVKDGRIMFQPFDMAFESSKIKMSGSHGIDMTLDYILDMDIAKSDLGQGANDLMNGMALLAAGAGIKIPPSDYVKVKAHITGTFDKPKVATDLSGNLKSARETVVETVEQQVKEEVKKVEEEVREEAGAQAEKIISDAEAEAERLIEEARKAGEALVKEAELQGDNLMKEAEGNTLKQIAAQRAALELKRQAEKQSENLIREAEEKADELIRQARAEAEKI